MVRNRGLPNVHPSMNEGRVEGPTGMWGEGREEEEEGEEAEINIFNNNLERVEKKEEEAFTSRKN